MASRLKMLLVAGNGKNGTFLFKRQVAVYKIVLCFLPVRLYHSNERIRAKAIKMNAIKEREPDDNTKGYAEHTGSKKVYSAAPKREPRWLCGLQQPWRTSKESEEGPGGV